MQPRQTLKSQRLELPLGIETEQMRGRARYRIGAQQLIRNNRKIIDRDRFDAKIERSASAGSKADSQ